MRVLMTGGGTGGHINPALAIANCIRENQPDSVIAFVGTPKGMENKLVPKEGYELYHVDVQGIKRSLSLKNFRAARLAVTSPIKAKKIIKSFKPDVVIGTGGYVSWPLLRAAAGMKIPTAVHESNAIPGVAVKVLARFVDRIYVNYDATADALGDAYREKILKVGNPIKPAFVSLNREEARKKLGVKEDQVFLLSYGGSLGAEKVNEQMLLFMRDYVAKHPEVLHVHATGAIEHEKATSVFKEYRLEKCENIRLVEYIYDMPEEMAAADVVVSRAGAMTLSELAVLGKASLLIPSPNVTDNHQYKNAKVLADAGAAVLREEKELVGNELEKVLSELLENPEKRKALRNNIGQFALTEANRLIYDDVCRMIADRKKTKG